MSEFIMLDDMDLTEVQSDLTKRPTISIRLRIILGFFLLFLLCVAASIASLIMESRISQKLKFMETVNFYTFEIQQARRYEKNFFLYRTNLPEAVENVQKAREILREESVNITAVISPAKLNTMIGHLNRYENLLDTLKTLQNRSPEDVGSFSEIERELRRHGAEMVFMAVILVDQERKEVEEISRWHRQIPLIFLVILLIMMIYLTHFLVQQIVIPLNRFVNYTSRIGQGDFTPIKAIRRYKDEFSRLAIAINWMMDQLKKNQEQYIQSRKMAVIGTLTSGIAHELNNPLNNICITTESLIDELEGLPDTEKRKRLDDIYTQAERASGTVRNLLDFTRMDTPSFVPVSVHELISATLRLVRHEMEINNIELKYAPEDTEAKIQGDFSQLQQVFLNLIINSIQAMPRGGTLSIQVKFDDPEFVHIDVTDTGMGIPEAILPQIFDPFFTTKEKGTGLGLSVSYSIIEKHGGKFLVKSQINQGSTFSVILPKYKE